MSGSSLKESKFLRFASKYFQDFSIPYYDVPFIAEQLGIDFLYLVEPFFDYLKIHQNIPKGYDHRNPLYEGMYDKIKVDLTNNQFYYFPDQKSMDDEKRFIDSLTDKNYKIGIEKLKKRRERVSREIDFNINIVELLGMTKKWTDSTDLRDTLNKIIAVIFIPFPRIGEMKDFVESFKIEKPDQYQSIPHDVKHIVWEYGERKLEDANTPPEARDPQDAVVDRDRSQCPSSSLYATVTNLINVIERRIGIQPDPISQYGAILFVNDFNGDQSNNYGNRRDQSDNNGNQRDQSDNNDFWLDYLTNFDSDVNDINTSDEDELLGS